MTDIVQQLRDMSGPNKPNVVSTAADLIESMRWRSIESEKPNNCSRILIHRVINGRSYVDVANYIEEPESGIKPLFDAVGIAHWMPLPKAPTHRASDMVQG